MSSKNRTINEETTLSVMSIIVRILHARGKNRKLIPSAFVIFIFAFPLLALHFSNVSFTFTQQISREFQTAAETPTLSLTYHSRFNATPTSVTSNSKLTGDHVILNATWTPADNVNGTVIEVNATAIPNTITAQGDNNTVEIDTRALGNNATCTINVTTWLLNGTVLTKFFTDVFVGNFFAPHVQVLTPNGGEIWTTQHNITWIAWDNNSDDTLTFEVLFSSDGGASFQLLASELNMEWLVWDFSEFQSHNSSIIEVRATDGIYTAFDKSDSPFEAGGIFTSTTTGPTATTPSAPAVDALDLRLGIFVTAAIIVSAFLSLIVYQQAKRLS